MVVHSEDWHRRQSESHKGKVLCSETRKRMSDSQKLRYKNGAVSYFKGKQLYSWKGKEFSDSHKNHISEGLKRAYENGRTNSISIALEAKKLKTPMPMLGHKQSEYQKRIVSEFMKTDKNPAKRPEVKEKLRQFRLTQRLPTKDTSFERRIQNILTRNDITFDKQKVIEDFVISDIFIEPNIVIFADGCYWHGCQVCFPDRMKFSGIQNRNLIRDAIVNQLFNNLGKYNVLRFWEHENDVEIEKMIMEVLYEKVQEGQKAYITNGQ
jgi:G:T-mismatch repair DNA endonuclease (very short patch repair protein)